MLFGNIGSYWQPPEIAVSKYIYQKSQQNLNKCREQGNRDEEEEDKGENKDEDEDFPRLLFALLYRCLALSNALFETHFSSVKRVTQLLFFCVKRATQMLFALHQELRPQVQHRAVLAAHHNLVAGTL